jgi:hypothetical protein
MDVDHNNYSLHAATVLCTATGCDHRACSQGPSRVVFFSLHDATTGDANFVAQACVSSPETGEWSEPCAGLPMSGNGFIEPNHAVLVKGALHLTVAYDYEDLEHPQEVVRLQILKYDLSSNCLSLIDAPSAVATSTYGNSILMAMEDGSLGFARLKKLRLCIWSRQMGSDGVAAWTRSRVISMKNIPPVKTPMKQIGLLGSMEGNDIVFVDTEHVIYKINLKTLRRNKMWEGEYINCLIPYMSFYSPQGVHLYLPSFVTRDQL